jgi:hypothetical protein
MGFNKPPTMPLMPAILPLNTKNSAVASPIIKPPINDIQGVKLCISIIIAASYSVGQ